MHPSTVFPEPIFIPKLIGIDTQFPNMFKGAKAFLVPANFFTIARYQKLCRSAIENCELCIIDPATNAFTYDGFLDKTTYNSLPYSPKTIGAPSKILSAMDFKLTSGLTERFVQTVIDFQVQNGAGILIAPYLFARDIDDGRFMVNLNLVSATLRYVQSEKLENPLFVMLNIGNSCIDNPRVLDLVVEQYADFDVQGFFVCIENFDDRVMSYEQLIGLGQLCQRLSLKHDLIMSTIASFGQVLTSLGINGFVGGVGWLETFRVINLQSGREAFGAQQIHRARYYYIPELFSYVRPDDIPIIFKECTSMKPYRCTCKICKKGLPTEPPDKKAHFLIRRFQELQNLAEVEADKRPEHMRQRLELALALAEDIENDALIRIPSEHLIRWLNVLDFLSSSPPSLIAEEGEDLDDLIHKVRKED